MDQVMLGADRVARTEASPSEQLALLGDELLGIIARYPDHVWVFLHEFPALTGERAEQFRKRRREYERRVEAVLKAGVGADRIGIGGGFPAFSDSIALSRAALNLGLRHVLVLPPYFDRNVTPDGIEDAFAAIIDGVADERLRAYLYHIPQVSGVAIPTGVAASLRKRYGKVIAGLKDSSGDFKQFQAFRAAAPELAITVGNEADIARAIAAGGAGTICGMANVVPELVKGMVDGKDVEARMQASIDIVLKTPSSTATLKAILAAQTGDASWLRVRPPLRASSDGAALKRKLDEVMAPAIA
jgi:4-hydroxy-tetrahydrodipicolinate synthase